jgi:hypothetical protein
MTIDEIMKINPVNKSSHEYLQKIFPEIQNYLGNEKINHIIDEKSIKKIFNNNAEITFSELLNTIYTQHGNRNISIPNKNKPFILTVDTNLDLSSGNFDTKINEIKKNIMKCYEYFFNNNKQLIKPKYIEIHENFIKSVKKMDYEIIIEDAEYKKAFTKQKNKERKLAISKNINFDKDEFDFDSTCSENEESNDDRICYEDFIAMKLPSDAYKFNNNIIYNCIKTYLELHSNVNNNALKKHKKIITELKLVIGQNQINESPDTKKFSISDIVL